MEKKADAKTDAAKTETAETTEAAAPKKVVVEIVRGQMPAPIVSLIKKEDAGLTDGALAAKWRTTNGKISDIRKGRNFGYINETYVPTAEEIEKAKAWAALHGGKEIVQVVDALVPGSEADRAKFDENKAAVRAAAKAARDAAAGKPPEAAKTDEAAKPEGAAKPEAEKKADPKAKKVSDKDLKDLTE